MTKKELSELQVQHRHGGGGWVYVQSLGDGYGRVVAAGPRTLGRQAFLVCDELLSHEMRESKEDKTVMERVPISPELMPAVNELRANLNSGEMKVVESWIQPARKV